MSTINGTLDLCHLPDDLYDPDQDYKVVVERQGEVLGSAVLKASPERSIPFDVQFTAPYLPGQHLPSPVVVRIGPNIDELEMVGFDALAIEVDLARHKGADAEKKTDAIRASVGVVQPSVELVGRWKFACRIYTIRGRVVCRQLVFDPRSGKYTFCDAPVPGAKVEAYDVDRFFIWYHRDLITTAVTDVDGYFTMHFRWCCLRFFPWLEKNWALDPDIFERVQGLLEHAGLPLPPVPPGPDPDPLYLQQVGAGARIASRGRLPAPSVLGAGLSADAMLEALPASKELADLHVWPWFELFDCAPDVVFRVTQRCGDELRVIHSESNAQIRWNIPTSLNVTLLANENACCLPCRTGEAPGCLTFTTVGCSPASQIGTMSGPPDVRGYGRASVMLDQPFFGALAIRGDIDPAVDYFKVEMSSDGGATWQTLPPPTLHGYGRSYWNGTGGVPVDFVPVVKSGIPVMMTRHHYEELNPGLPQFNGHVIWFDYDTLFVFDTKASPGLTPDGLYALRLVGYPANANDDLVLNEARILMSCSPEKHEERLFIRVDNQATNNHAGLSHACGNGTIHACTVEPDCYIRSICINEGLPGAHCISACDIVRLADSDTVTIHFSATVPPTTTDGHLGGYTMNAYYGVSQTFAIGLGAHGTFMPDSPPSFAVGPTYAQALAQGAQRPHWYGGDYKVVLHASDFPLCCAYLLRLDAWKRTTDGCSDPRFVHNNVFELTFTILREGLC